MLDTRLRRALEDSQKNVEPITLDDKDDSIALQTVIDFANMSSVYMRKFMRAHGHFHAEINSSTCKTDSDKGFTLTPFLAAMPLRSSGPWSWPTSTSPCLY